MPTGTKFKPTKKKQVSKLKNKILSEVRKQEMRAIAINLYGCIQSIYNSPQ